MRFDYGYAEENHLGKPYNMGLLMRLAPFLRPYSRLLVGSVALVVLITLLELALPYFSKVAIDRYIIPEPQASALLDGPRTNPEPMRLIIVDADDPEVRRIVANHPDLFEHTAEGPRIRFKDLDRFSSADLKILRRNDLKGLTLVAAVFFAVVICDFILTFFQKVIMEYAGHKVMHDLRMRLYEHIQDQSLAFFSGQPTARLVTRVTNDVQNMHELFTTFIAMVFKDFFLLIGIAVMLLVLDWRLAPAGFIVLPLVAWVSARFSIRARDIFRALRVKVAQINSRISETIEGIRTIQSFVREASNYHHFADLNGENYRLGMRQIHIFAVFMPVIELLGITATAILLFYGGWHVLENTITIGVLVLAISYMRMFFRPLRDLAENYNVLQNAMASAERIFGIFDTDQRLPEVARASNRVLNTDEKLRAIALDRVSFAYKPGEWVLRDVSISVPAGRTVALVGQTGAGKTSVLNLIMRFYDPAAGRVCVNNTDLRELNIRRFRDRVAYVPQDPILFSGTLRDNIFPDASNVDETTVNRIIHAANCDLVVDRLPDGLDTELVKSGAGLSSGERQLVAIARALARDPELILLDEATSYIDSQTEAVIYRALENLMTGRTGIIVAHRLSTARSADHIVVMHHGRAAEAGTHEALMALKGLYFRLGRQQNGV
jgi:ATP-binding cassette subfamily B protein